jgi:hypothetical protein
LSLTPNENLLRKLIQDIHAWNGDARRFADIVRNALDIAPDRRALAHHLAGEFECAVSTVQRWAKGVASPHPLVRKLVLESIRKRLEGSRR